MRHTALDEKKRFQSHFDDIKDESTSPTEEGNVINQEERQSALQSHKDMHGQTTVPLRESTTSTQERGYTQQSTNMMLGQSTECDGPLIPSTYTITSQFSVPSRKSFTPSPSYDESPRRGSVGSRQRAMSHEKRIESSIPRMGTKPDVVSDT